MRSSGAGGEERRKEQRGMGDEGLGAMREWRAEVPAGCEGPEVDGVPGGCSRPPQPGERFPASPGGALHASGAAIPLLPSTKTAQAVFHQALSDRRPSHLPLPAV